MFIFKNNDKLELRKIKYAAFASEETACFEADVYLNGVAILTAQNSGKGGATNFHHHNYEKFSAKDLQELETRLEQECNRDLELWCALELDDWLLEKQWKREIKKKLLFIKHGEKGVSTLSLKA